MVNGFPVQFIVLHKVTVNMEGEMGLRMKHTGKRAHECMFQLGSNAVIDHWPLPHF